MMDIGRHAPICLRFKAPREAPREALGEGAFLLEKDGILKAALAPAASSAVAGRRAAALTLALLGFAFLQIVAQRLGLALAARIGVTGATGATGLWRFLAGLGGGFARRFSFEGHGRDTAPRLWRGQGHWMAAPLTLRPF